MTQKKQQAISLMIEDLYTSHYEIRTIAKQLDCEKELEKIKIDLINQLRSLK